MTDSRDISIVFRPYDEGQRGFDEEEQREAPALAGAAETYADRLRERGSDVFDRRRNVIAAESGVFVAYFTDEITASA